MTHMRRADREVTSPDELSAILDRASIGHLGVQDAGGVYVVPLHFGHEIGVDGVFRVYMHCAAGAGRKLDAIAANPRVCFEADTFISLTGESGPVCMLGAEFESVIGWGDARVLADPTERRHGCAVLVDKFAPGRGAELPLELMRGVDIIEVRLETLSGKQKRM
ncbi:MAG: pyridoxamine 5'-phosphate oxidase family protein [Propionibacteriaceae bacterium]|nr:pyridoxamine 5'-phosphate oxidase family protein [Propionibacteriaceae bacterium]